MAKYVVELGDSEGHSFKIALTLPFIVSSDGSWRSIDKGYIRYNSGKAKRYEVEGKEGYALVLFNGNNKVGIQLYEFEDFWGVNDEGAGYLVQSWVLGMEPGNISWTVVD